MVSSATLTMAMPQHKNCTTRYWNQCCSGLTEAGLTLNVDRCTFRVPKIKFLVNVMSADGIEADPDNVSAVVNLPIPKNVHEVRVPGMVNHLCKF